MYPTREESRLGGEYCVLNQMDARAFYIRLPGSSLGLKPSLFKFHTHPILLDFLEKTIKLNQIYTRNNQIALEMIEVMELHPK
jgi:hypothetical protein